MFTGARFAGFQEVTIKREKAFIEDMAKIARWKIRPVAVGDVHGNVQELERRIIPVYRPVLVGTLAGHFPEPSGEWNYELLEINDETCSFLAREITKKNPALDAIVKNALFQLVIRINQNKFRHISRFHAMLGTVNGDLYVADLESKNRTYAGVAIEPGYPLMLTDGQTIRLGGREEDSAQIKIYEAITFASALLVGVDYQKKAETTVEKTIWQMDNLIRKLKVPYECNILKHGQATREEILRHLKRAEAIPEKSLFFFFYDAHGSRQSLTTKDGEITKSELAGILNRIKAKKVILIDSCHAEGGWEELDLESGLYFFSSKEDETSKWGLFAQGFAGRIAGMINAPIDMKGLEISDLVKREDQNPVKIGYKSVILF